MKVQPQQFRQRIRIDAIGFLASLVCAWRDAKDFARRFWRWAEDAESGVLSLAGWKAVRTVAAEAGVLIRQPQREKIGETENEQKKNAGISAARIIASCQGTVQRSGAFAKVTRRANPFLFLLESAVPFHGRYDYEHDGSPILTTHTSCA